MSDARSEKEVWDSFKDMIGENSLRLGERWTRIFRDSPEELPGMFSAYKFAAKMIGRERSILELGCGEGIGVSILAEFSPKYLGVDRELDAVGWAQAAWGSDRRSFQSGEFIGKRHGEFDAVFCLNVVPYWAENPDVFFKTVIDNTAAKGIALLGVRNAPNRDDSLRKALDREFQNVFFFGMSEEVVHTGGSETASDGMYLACNRRAS